MSTTDRFRDNATEPMTACFLLVSPYYTRADGESPYVSWPHSAASVEKTIKTFDDVVGKIASYQFSNKNVKKCAQLCDSCDLRFFCHYK